MTMECLSGSSGSMTSSLVILCGCVPTARSKFSALLDGHQSHFFSGLHTEGAVFGNTHH